VGDTSLLEYRSTVFSGSVETMPRSRRREANSPHASHLWGTWQPRCGLESSSNLLARAGQARSGHRMVKKRRPAAERQGECITRRIGQYPLRKEADVARWLVAQTRERALIQRKSWIPLRVNVTLEHHAVCYWSPGTVDPLLELGAARVARPVLRGRGGGNITSLPNHILPSPPKS
jgi:hypothetical protein